MNGALHATPKHSDYGGQRNVVNSWATTQHATPCVYREFIHWLSFLGFTVHHVAGLGHHDMLALKFHGGLSLTLTPLAGLWIVDHVAEAVARMGASEQ